MTTQELLDEIGASMADMRPLRDTDAEIDLDRHALASADAHKRLTAWIKDHPGEDSREAAARIYAEARADAGLEEEPVPTHELGGEAGV